MNVVAQFTNSWKTCGFFLFISLLVGGIQVLAASAISDSQPVERDVSCTAKSFEPQEVSKSETVTLTVMCGEHAARTRDARFIVSYLNKKPNSFTCTRYKDDTASCKI